MGSLHIAKLHLVLLEGTKRMANKQPANTGLEPERAEVIAVDLDGLWIKPTWDCSCTIAEQMLLQQLRDQAGSSFQPIVFLELHL